MASNLDRYKDDLNRLVHLGETLSSALNATTLDDLNDVELQLLGINDRTALKNIKGEHIFMAEYQGWYTEASAVVRQLIPDRIHEFEQLYKGDGRRKEIDALTFTIQDWLNGARVTKNSSTGKKRFEDVTSVIMRLYNQIQILGSARGRFESTLFDIRQMVQADLFDSELDSASELVEHGFLRGAGAIAGVVLEKHLAQVASNHAIKTRKKDPTISDFNDLLKNGNVLDVPTWRQVQRLSDIRNLCDHNKDRDPTKDEVEELINGVEKISKTLF